MCLNVTYVEGHELPAECYIVFRCSTTGHDMYHTTIQGSSMCIPNVSAHPSYTIIATDGDAVDEINTTAPVPVTILGVVVSEYTVMQSSAPGATPTPTGLSLPSFYTLTCNTTYRAHNCTRISITDSSDCSTSVW